MAAGRIEVTAARWLPGDHISLYTVTKEASSSEDELNNDIEFDPQESNKDDLDIQLDNKPWNSMERLGDDVKDTLREMKEMMEVPCERMTSV